MLVRWSIAEEACRIADVYLSDLTAIYASDSPPLNDQNWSVEIFAERMAACERIASEGERSAEAKENARDLVCGSHRANRNSKHLVALAARKEEDARDTTVKGTELGIGVNIIRRVLSKVTVAPISFTRKAWHTLEVKEIDLNLVEADDDEDRMLEEWLSVCLVEVVAISRNNPHVTTRNMRRRLAGEIIHIVVNPNRPATNLTQAAISAMVSQILSTKRPGEIRRPQEKVEGRYRHWRPPE